MFNCFANQPNSQLTSLTRSIHQHLQRKLLNTGYNETNTIAYWSIQTGSANVGVYHYDVFYVS